MISPPSQFFQQLLITVIGTRIMYNWFKNKAIHFHKFNDHNKCGLLNRHNIFSRKYILNFKYFFSVLDSINIFGFIYENNFYLIILDLKFSSNF